MISEHFSYETLRLNIDLTDLRHGKLDVNQLLRTNASPMPKTGPAAECCGSRQQSSSLSLSLLLVVFNGRNGVARNQQIEPETKKTLPLAAIANAKPRIYGGRQTLLWVLSLSFSLFSRAHTMTWNSNSAPLRLD